MVLSFKKTNSNQHTLQPQSIQFLFAILILLIQCVVVVDGYQIGTGIADITGPVAQVMMMGYAEFGQTGQGLLQRLWARSYIIQDEHKRIVFVNTDTQSMGDLVKKRVVQKLQEKYGLDTYTEKNVMISSTHSHSGVGGYLQYTLYEISVMGWVEESVVPLVNGIVESIIRAHDKLQNGSVELSQGELLNTNINRSPKAYLMNPADERLLYQHNVEKMMKVLSFKSEETGDGLGLVSWYAVHGVSINSTNRLINGDNKGYAAYLAEKLLNDKETLSGKGRFVAAFAQGNMGDVSPNTLGFYCIGTDIPCDGTRGTVCPGNSKCIGRGPGWEKSDIESNRIIGENQALKAIELYQASANSKRLIEGKIDHVQRYWDITKASVLNKNGQEAQLCQPAMGYSFAAGTTDGPAFKAFHQNMNESSFGWNLVAGLIKSPTKTQVACQAPKPILIDTGEIKLSHPWQPEILDVQLFRLGNVFIYAVPSEFTTMSGRRLERHLKQTLIKYGLGDDETVLIQSGPANGYASYCTTFEEYQHQRYEGASTPYGPHTLEAYMNVFDELVYMMANPETHNIKSLDIPDYSKITFDLTPRFMADRPHMFRSFGDVLRDVENFYKLKNETTIISALFVSGNPRNNPMLDKTFLTVEKKLANGEWKTIRNDNDYDTRFIWKYKHQFIGVSEANIEWHIKNNEVEHGIYRLGYFGNSKKFSGKIIPHHGYSSEFQVMNDDGSKVKFVYQH